jgi:flagellar basal-body rod modification protein FlgD
MAIGSTTPISPEAAATLARLRAEETARNAKLLTDKGTSATASSDQMGKDTFLKLLVAQLKYQNPMQPSDPSAFMAQTAQLSMVEKLETMAKATMELLTSERSRGATGMLGNQVTWTGLDGKDASGVVTGVRMGSDGPTLVVGDTDVPYAAITKVTAAPAPVAHDSATVATSPQAPSA